MGDQIDTMKTCLTKQWELVLITFLTGLTLILKSEDIEMEGFLIGCITICYLAKYTGDTMEALCEYIPSRLVGLISAFLGNVPEAVTNAVALSKNIDYFILLALIGGCIANGLILMGTCIVASEYYFPGKELEDRSVHLMNMGVFAAMSLLVSIPSMVKGSGASDGTVLGWTYFIDIVLLCLYLYITHFQLTYSEPDASPAEYEAVAPAVSSTMHGDLEENCGAIEMLSTSKNMDESANSETVIDLSVSAPNPDSEGDLETKEEEEELEGVYTLLAKLVYAVVCIGFSSDVVTGTIEEMNEGGKLPVDFMIFAVVGIVGNVPEHYSAMYMSITKGDLSLAYATSFGSSGQLIGLILPILSLIGGFEMIFTTKYLIMLQLSWIVPLYLVYYRAHSVTAGWVLVLMYVLCAILSAF